MFFKLIRQSIKGWQEDKASVWCAALAYYTVFSIGPLLLIVISVVGLIFTKTQIDKEIYGQVQGLLGANGAKMFETLLDSTKKPTSGIIGTVVGTITLILGAAGVFGQLQQMLDAIWGVEQKPRAGLLALIRSRLLNFSMIGVIAFLLLVSLVATTAISTIGTYIGGFLPASPIILEIINFIISLVLTTILFALIMKVLPDVQIRWENVWIGAFVTAILFTIGKAIIGIYIGHSGVSSTYGAAASLVILLLWVYYSSQILFLGMELTKAYTLQKDKKIVPSKFAMLINQNNQLPKKNNHNKSVSSFTRGFLEGLTDEIRGTRIKKK